jgi:hypothetical protein
MRLPASGPAFESAEQPRIFLSTLRAGAIDRRQAGASVIVALVVFAATAPFAQVPLPRLTGSSGTSNTFVYQDLAEFPNLAKRCSATRAGRAAGRRPAPDRSESAIRPRHSLTSTT